MKDADEPDCCASSTPRLPRVGDFWEDCAMTEVGGVALMWKYCAIVGLGGV